MKKLLTLVLVVMFIFTGLSLAEGFDLSSMTDDELAALREQIEDELDQRANDAKAAELAAAAENGEVLLTDTDTAFPKLIFSSEEQLKSCLIKVELTTDNWTEYLGDYYYEDYDYDTDNFGDVTWSADRRYVGFGFKDGYAGCFTDAAFKFTGRSAYRMIAEYDDETDHTAFVGEEWTEYAEEYSFDMYNYGKRDVHLGDYECIAAVGVMYVLEVPAEFTALWCDPYLATADIYVGDLYVGYVGGLHYLYEKLFYEQP